MPAYLIINAKITDQSQLDAYSAAVVPTLSGHEFKVLGFTTDTETLHGSPPGERTVVMEFPDRAALHAWYDSPAYQVVRELRFAGTSGFDLAIDGF